MPSDPKEAQKIEVSSDNFILIDRILYRAKGSQKRSDKHKGEQFKIVLPRTLRKEALLAYHDSRQEEDTRG